MPELPDLTIYRDALDARVRGQIAEQRPHPQSLSCCAPPSRRSPTPKASASSTYAASASASSSRSTTTLPGPPPDDRRPPALAAPRRARPPGRITLAALRVRERHARAHRGRHEDAARRCTACRARPRSRAFDPGGLEVLDATLAAFAARLTRENHTLKRALTDPHLFSGIGNAYSDEILHRARLSPVDAHRAGSTTTRSRGCSTRRARSSPNGPSACARRPATAFRRR